MHIDNIMADYHKAKESRSRDAQNFPLDEGTFEALAERLIDRKQRLVQSLGLDEHGRTALVVKRTIKEALADVELWSQTVSTWREMLTQIYSWLNESGYEADERGGKERSNLFAWAFAGLDSQMASHSSLLAAYGDDEAPMFTDACGRRVRIGKALTKAGVNYTLWERRLSIVVEDIRNATSRTVVLSVNPLDMYLMSSDTNNAYTSCHSPNGMRQGGPWQYMGDRISLVAMTIAGGVEGAGEFPFVKDGRAMVYVPDDNSVVVGRGYGRMQRNYGMAKIITARLTEALGGDWVAKNDISYPHTKQNRTAAYHDAETLRVSIRDLVRGEQLVENNLPFLSFTQPICASCGEDYERDDDDYDHKRECDSCAPGYAYSCEECDAGVHEEDAYHDDSGNTYCADCHSSLFDTCRNCSETTRREDMSEVHVRTRYNGVVFRAWCESCVQSDSFRCERCDEQSENELGVTVHVTGHHRWGWSGNNSSTRIEECTWCTECAEDNAETCDECDQTVSTCNASVPALVKVQGSDTHQCQECLADAVASDDVVQYAGQYFTQAAMVQYRIDEFVAVVLEDELAFAKKEVLA